MKKAITIISLVFFVALIGQSVFAFKKRGYGRGYGRYGECPGYGNYGNNFQDRNSSQRSNLTKEQDNKLLALEKKFFEDTDEMRSERSNKQDEMYEIMDEDKPDKAKLGKLSSDIAKLDKQIIDKRIEFQLKARKIAPDLQNRQGNGYHRYNRYKGYHRYGRGRGGWDGHMMDWDY